jgi:hypothetical protein
MGYFKRLVERVMARDFERQVSELQVRVFILNRFTQLAHLRQCAWRNSIWGHRHCSRI